MLASQGAFFGRRKGKTLKVAQASALAEILPSLRLDLNAPPPVRISDLFPVPVRDFRLEIGFGGGEHLLYEAEAYPLTGFFGVEPFVNGMAKAVTALAENRLPNVRLYDDDAVRLLDWLPEGSLSRIDLLYPDPWPKLRHRKRRFVNRANLERIARALVPSGEFRFASDVPEYVKWTLTEVRGFGGLRWTHRDVEECRTPWVGWPGTRYEAKAIAEGRRPAYLSFRKEAAEF